MRVLGLETAGRAVSAALVEGKEVLAEAWVAASQQHCRELMPLVEWCLEKARVPFSEVDGFAVSLGPGSFTGLRIGVATAKALALASGKRLVGVSAFQALAAAAGGFPGLVCPVLPSRPGEVYAAFLRRRGQEWQFVEPPLALPPGALLKRLPPGEDGVLLLGEGVSLLLQEGKLLVGPRVSVASPVNGRLLASQVAYLGQEKLTAGADDNLWELEPYYFRPPGITLKGR